MWQVPGKPVRIHLSLEVVDRLQQDVMRGFGSVPRRGAEIGGILLGAVESGSRDVRVEAYELISIEYKLGPSYRFSGKDAETFEKALQALRGRRTSRPVGYFRSHTREGVGLSDEDRALVAKSFPEPEAIVLLIRPFATKPSVAGFYFKENGAFQDGSPPVEFPLRSKDLAPGDAAPRLWQEASAPAAGQAAANRRTWPLLFTLLLLVGIMLGYQAALTMRPQTPRDPYRLGLTIKRSGGDLQLNWDRNSSAILSAQRAILTIEDGSDAKALNLGPAALRIGSAAPYHPVTKEVRFRLDLFLNSRNSVSETIESNQ